MKATRPLLLSLAASHLTSVAAVVKFRVGDEPAQPILQFPHVADDPDDDQSMNHWAVTGDEETECDHANPDVKEMCKQAKEHNNQACSPKLYTGGAHRECKYEDGTDCDIKDLEDDRSTLIYPGNETECLLGIPYKFQVIKRDLDKLLITFQGGGSCSSQKAVAMGMCCEKPVPHMAMGIHGGSYMVNGHEANPFARHTVLHILYCSGDSHLGNKSTPWSWKKHNVNQRGLLNAFSALVWAKKNMNKELTSLVIHGSSAGSFAAQAWANSILSKDYFGNYKQAWVLLDCGIGVFDDEQVAKSLAQASSQCKQGYWSYEIYKKCVLKTLTFKDMLEDTVRRYKDVGFLFVDSKNDPVLTKYYNLYQTMSGTENILKPGEYYKKVQTNMERFSGQFKNVVQFLVDESRHTFLTTPSTWRTTSSLSAGSMALATWLRGIMDGICHDGSWICSGPTMKIKDAPESIDWCDSSTTGKQYTKCNLPR